MSCVSRGRIGDRRQSEAAEYGTPGPHFFGGWGRGAGEAPPRPSSMPIDVGGGLISLGGRASDSRRSVYRQPGQPGERLDDHEDAQGAGDTRHPLDSATVLLAQRLVAVASRGKPPERVGLRLGRGLLLELVVELLRVDRGFRFHGASRIAAATRPRTREPSAIHPHASSPVSRIVVAPRKEATRACAASSVPVRWRTPATSASWSASASRPAS